MKSGIEIIEKDKGRILGVAGGNYRIIVPGEKTDNQYAVIEMIVPPGGGPPPHSHPDTHETFYVLEGEVEFQTEQGKSIVGTGGFITIPLGGAIHCFTNTSSSVAKLLCTVMPAGLEKVFELVGVPVGSGEFAPIPELTDERRELMARIDKQYGQKTYPKGYLD
ncbi:cupin domain-containing protein [Olivibacter sp. CPCC 100613]|uniref:cupin domain-containing protein n=1 Tax=Olivibacter sp. CPCC 100613 TaxID=3079931 RepID=UPI002FF616C9